ncbi:MAG: hypothetical protein FJ303_27660 [Planctomycetes bacterium]|nr:hypothetical protein [Planctomycetota bacterium]
MQICEGLELATKRMSSTGKLSPRTSLKSLNKVNACSPFFMRPPDDELARFAGQRHFPIPLGVDLLPLPGEHVIRSAIEDRGPQAEFFEISKNAFALSN